MPLFLMPFSPALHRAIVVLLALLALGLSLRLKRYEGPNLYGVQAQAWLEGRLDVPGPAEDMSLYGGRYYVAFPPFPSVVLLPVVALTGHERVPYRAVALGVSLLTAWAAWRVLRRLDIPPEARPWLVAALLAGTAFWFCVVQSEAVWFFAHVVAVTCSLLALEEALGKGRGGWAGLWVGLAFLSRQLCVYLVPFIALAVWLRHAEAGRRRQVWQAGGALAVVGACAGVYLVLNALRFGHPFNTGYAGMPLEDFLAVRVARYGLFHPAYVPFNFFHMFLEGPHFVFGGARQLAPNGMDGMGTSLTLASPFVFVALAARGERLFRVGAWSVVLLALTHMLFYYNNGWVQTNAQRFTLDFLPVLWVLVALGTRHLEARVWKGLVAWSIGLNVFALALMPVLMRSLHRL
ncbi:glycosyltransferase family 39 protein [Stigmatella sp. ncwal1]|uniref:Glycosyltransferase family 39 protein n=1 Tax=Stigmatella ashevillensis TaxID=2995309 RepID=A0ABT5DH22_9BACT|nr:glycosyltransferase family 39 protein [Stigmatella ashevillena]MDC0712894.1 glycosyltransferase family 39 protein [Stigmatella ashevillena]